MSSINSLQSEDPEEQFTSPMFKPQPDPEILVKIDGTFDETKEGNDAGTFASPYNDFELQPFSTRQPFESSFTTNLQTRNNSMVLRQKGPSIPIDMQLYASKSNAPPEQFDFLNIPAPEPYCSQASKLIKKIYAKNGNSSLERSYTAAKKRQANRQVFEPKNKKHPHSSIIINPRDTYHSFDKFSKSQRLYNRYYQKALEETCAQFGQNKPLESEFCVDNYIYSQVCPSGLATNKFISVRAKKRLSLMQTTTLSSDAYPFSPRTASELKSIERKVNGSRERIARVKSRKDPHYDKYFDTLIRNTADQDFAKHFQLLRQKKSVSYGSRYEELEDVIEYMRKEGSDVNTAHDIVMEVISHRKKQRRI